MEPASAFAIACGVIQVVDFALKTTSEARKIIGESSIRSDLEHASQELNGACNDLDRSLSAIDTTQMTNSAERELTKVCFNCRVAAMRLQQEVLKGAIESGVKGVRRTFKAISKSIKANWNARKLDELEKEFEAYRKALNTRVLVQLFLDGKSFAEQMSKEHVSTRTHVTKEMQGLRNVLQESGHVKKVLDSLAFPEMRSREENVKDAHGKTFNWIFDEPESTERKPWSSVVSWLRSDSNLFWITGKAGSGRDFSFPFRC